MTTSLTKGHFLFKPVSKPPKEKTGSRKRRFEATAEHNYFHYYFETLEEKVNKVVKGSYSQMSERICNYLVQSLEENRTRPYKVFQSIPTAAIISGTNMADHEFMYEELKESLTSQISIATILLNSRNSSSLKSCWKHIITTLYDRLDLERSDKTTQHTSATLKSLLLTRGTDKIHDTPLPLIVIFEDFEAMPERVINHIIMNLYEQSDELAIGIVVNVAIFINTLHQKICWNASSHLEIRVFEPSPSQHLLNQILDEIIVIPRIPFVVGPNLLAWLLDHFLSHTVSISQFTHSLKVALYYHMQTRCFLEHKFSENLDSDLACFNRTELIQRMAQFQNKESEKTGGKRKSSNQLQHTFFQAQQFYDWYELAIGLAAAIYGLLQVMGREVQLFAKDYHSIYILLLKGDLLAEENFQGALKYLGSTSKKQLFVDCIKICVKELAKIIRKLHIEEEKSSLANIVDKFSCMLQLLSTDDSPSLKLRTEIVSAIQELITEYFLSRNPTKHSLASIAMCELPNEMSMLVDPPLLASIHEGLLKPKDSVGARLNQAAEPNICSVYQLMTESGKYVNLYDWYQSYHFSQTEQDGEGNPSDDIVQAKFFAAVAELEFLGIIQPVKRKIDHVQKLTQGIF